MENYINKSELAQILGLSVRRINQLVKENVLKKEISGKFNTADTLETYYKFKFKTDEDLTYEHEHALLERAKREKAEIELAQLKNSLLYASDVEQLMKNIIQTFNTKTLSIPQKCAPKILGQTNLPVITEIIKREICSALTELAQIPAENLEEAK